MFDRSTLRGTVAVLALVGLAACGGPDRGPPGTEASRAVDRASGTNTSGAYPAQSDGTRSNPSGTAVGRAVDRATR